MPWKYENDPYKIWLSEIILQQTQAAQAIPYYHTFLDNYPTVFDLANATEEQVMRHWAGLGYYNRALNLHRTAKVISGQYAGKFPGTYDDLLMLPGIGPYTAAAISSFAFNQPHAVVDGNVIRVLSRVFGITESVKSTTVRKKVNLLAQQLLDKKYPALYNQAIMDFGAQVCKPALPGCTNCVMNRSCFALKRNMVGVLPKNKKQKAKKERYLNYLIINHKDNYLVKQRSESDIWKKLFEFPLIETNQPAELNELLERMGWNIRSKKEIGAPVQTRHLLTHRILHLNVYNVSVSAREYRSLSKRYECVSKDKLNELAFPKPLAQYIHKHINISVL